MSMEVVDGAKALEEQAASSGLGVCWGHAEAGGAGSPPCVLGSGGVPRLPCRVTTVLCCLSTCPCSSAVPRAGRALCLHFPTSTSPSASATSCLSPHLPLSQGLGKPAIWKSGVGGPATAAGGLGVSGMQPGRCGNPP